MVPFNSASPQTEATTTLFAIVFIIAGAILLLVTGGVLFSAVRFRHRAGEDREPVQHEGNLRLEIAWTVAPFLLLAFVSVLMLDNMGALATPLTEADEAEIVVTGHQWWWRVEYPDAGAVTANEIHIPAGRPVLVRLASADVIHSFWVPELGGKADMVPGQTVVTTLEANRPGTYLGACAEYCGIQHAWMRLRVIAHPEHEYQEWLANQQEEPAPPSGGEAAEGHRLFQELTCVNCHTVAGTSASTTRGPDLTHFASRATLGAGVLANTPASLTRWLQDPQTVKPGNHMPRFNLTDEQVRLLAAYLETLE